MMIYKITPSVDYYYLLKRSNTQLNEPTNQILLKSQKLLSQRIRKHNKKKSLGTGVSNSMQTYATNLYNQLHNKNLLFGGR